MVESIEKPRVLGRKQSLITDSIFIVLALYFIFVYARSFFMIQHQLTALAYSTFFLAIQLMALSLFLVRKRAKVISSKSPDYLYTLLALGLPLLFRSVMDVGTSNIGTIVAGVLGVAGAALVMGGFLSLNRSFGIAPENRGVKSSGVYRFVRHPMYSGYILAESGFLIIYLSWYNVLVLFLSVTFLLLRLRAEERLLEKDPAYKGYRKKTPWKLMPGIF